MSLIFDYFLFLHVFSLWENSNLCYRFGKNCCYNFLSYIFSVPTSLCWGCTFGVTAFYHVWLFMPLLRLQSIVSHIIRKFISIILYSKRQKFILILEYFATIINNYFIFSFIDTDIWNTWAYSKSNIRATVQWRTAETFTRKTTYNRLYQVSQFRTAHNSSHEVQ